MANDFSNPNQTTYHRRTIVFLGLVALLAPVSYLAGRFATEWQVPEPFSFISIGASMAGLGALMGIPIGLFFGSLKSQAPGKIVHHFHPTFIRQQDKILEQLKDELNRAKVILRERLGDSVSATALQYDTTFWTAVKASGQLFVMQEPELLATVSRAYHWLDEANRLEGQAFSAHYAPMAEVDHLNATTHILAEARKLDAILTSSIDLAIIAIDAQLGIDRTTPPGAEPEAVVAHSEEVTG